MKVFVLLRRAALGPWVSDWPVSSRAGPTGHSTLTSRWV